MANQEFDVVIIDEATQAIEAVSQWPTHVVLYATIVTKNIIIDAQFFWASILMGKLEIDPMS